MALQVFSRLFVVSGQRLDIRKSLSPWEGDRATVAHTFDRTGIRSNSYQIQLNSYTKGTLWHEVIGRRAQIAPRLSLDKLEQPDRQSQDRVERCRYQIVGALDFADPPL